MSLHNISIMGDGSLTSGSYKSVRIMGNGKFLGDIEADKLSIMGNLYSENNLKVGTLSVSGNGEFGNVEAQMFSVMGNADVGGNLKAETVKVSGEANIKGNIKAQFIKIQGSMEGKAAETEFFNSKGAFELLSLNANDMRVKLYGPSKVREIGGETIHVSYPRVKKILVDMLDILLFKKTKRSQLIAGTIEADRIYLEYTIADSVKGNNIVIGPGCKIKNVEYSNSLYIDNDSSVDSNIKV